MSAKHIISKQKYIYEYYRIAGPNTEMAKENYRYIENAYEISFSILVAQNVYQAARFMQMNWWHH